MIFKCVSCDADLNLSPRVKRPLCDFCLEILVPANDDFLDITHPGLEVRTLFLNSLHASYLATGPTHRTLKAWKKSPSPQIESLLLNPYKESFRTFTKDMGVSCITFIPQEFERAWELKGGSGYRLAQWISQNTGVPLIPGLHLQSKSTSQSSLSLSERKQNRIEFTTTREIQHTPSVLLVDDWMTSGKTLQSGAFALRLAGVSHVHAWVLGVRPRTQLKSYRRSKTIRQENQLIS